MLANPVRHISTAMLVPIAHAQEPFSLDALRARARDLATRPFVPPRTDDLPGWLAKLDFDDYRKIRFREATALWGAEKLPFRLHFSHRGYLFGMRVPIHVVDGAQVAELRFAPEQFEYGGGTPEAVPPTLGYAGVTILFDSQDRWTEVASFRGASFFRLIGAGQHYGTSARGLTVDAATAAGEEHPSFTAMWIERPLPGADRLTLYALLDSPSLAGAYRFVLTYGAQTSADVEATLYPRRTVAKLGLAPLSSMFLHGEQRDRAVLDYRPERHDADGLLFADAGGGWSWRPLFNPQQVHRVTAHPLQDPIGFGLLQRDRSFASYLDLHDRYELRPSLWIAPKGGWGAGTLELLEIPSDVAHNDNMACYWVPKTALAPGGELTFAYTVTAFLDDANRPPLARVRNTLIERHRGGDRILLDFEGQQLGDDLAQLRADVTCSRGSVQNVVLERNDAAGGMRCSFDLAPADDAVFEVRASLWRDQRQVTETWVMPWQRR